MSSESINLHHYPDGILVEVIVDEGNGQVTTESIEFELTDGDDHVVTPRAEFPERHEQAIREHLEDLNYTVQGVRA